MNKLMKGFTSLLFCSTLLSFLRSSTGEDTLQANQTIQGSETIVSDDGTFELGFFSLGNSKNRYLCIKYKEKANGTIVWVANRDAPLAPSDGVLQLSSKGNLVLYNASKSIIWSSISSSSSGNPVAQLLYTGNLVIRNENEFDPGKFFWKSFDYLDNTLLPGMKIGRNLVTGHDWSLRSWKSSDDPSLGNYILQLDTSGYPQLFLRKDSAIITRVGPWNGIRFSGLPTLGPNNIYTYQYVLNEKEIYFTYELINRSVLMRITMDPEGQVERFTWIDQKNVWELYVDLQMDACGTYAKCGIYGSCNINNSTSCGCLNGFEPKSAAEWGKADWSGGCVRKSQLNCHGGDKFQEYINRKLPDTRNSWYNMSMSSKECKEKCLRNCSCTAYANTNITGKGSGCLLWYGDLVDIRELNENPPQSLFVRLAASEFDENSISTAKRIVIFTCFAILLILTIIVGRYLWYIVKCRKQQREEEARLNVENTRNNEDRSEDLPIFDFRTIANATNNFSITSKIGEGGFGPVYKGILGGQEIAVKRLSLNSRQGWEEFRNEVSCIAKLQHRNLVRLLGCSMEEGERMLIYEYMPNKSLDYFIFGDNERRKSLDWPKRYNIIIGIARGLLYLHQDSRLRVIHRDLKASNILLDFEMNPKISDFGLARSFGGNETEAETNRVVGTFGYMPPEYAIDGLFSVKSDVYSFGVLLLEIVTGKKNRFFKHPDHNLNLLGHAWRSYNEDMLFELIDGETLESCKQNEVFRVVQTGLLCVQHYPEDRPHMSYVVMMLSGETSLPHPKQPGFFTERKLYEADSSMSKSKSESSPFSITIVEPR